jgi:hypothetical protein
LKEKTVAPLLDHVFLIHTTTLIPDPQPLQKARAGRLGGPESG